MGIHRKIPYRNHAYRHAPGGSDPISSDPRDFVVLSRTSVTVTTPWTLDTVITQSSSNVGPGGHFAVDASGTGFEVLQTCQAHVICGVTVTATGHNIPTSLQAFLALFTPGSPSTGSFPDGFICQSFGQTVDNALPFPGIFLSFAGIRTFTDGDSHGIALQAAGASADWKYKASMRVERVILP